MQHHDAGAAPLLEGLRVLEVATWIAAPAIGTMLAEYGADVTHVEDPARGDPFRTLVTQLWSRASIEGQVNSSFEMHNRNKRSLALSLDSEEGQAIFRRLVEKADILITNLLPASQKKLRLDYARLCGLNPRLIHVGVSGWGTQGPQTQQRGYDFTVFWAASGIMSLVGDPNGSPALVRPGMGDRTTALAGLAGLGMALYNRERTGKGQALEVSLLHTGMFTIASDLQRAEMYGEAGPKYSRNEAPAPLTNCYRTRDGRWIVINVLTETEWPVFCECLGMPQLARDDRFASSAQRGKNHLELISVVDKAFAQFDRAEWERRLQAAQLTHATALLPEELLHHPQVEANDLFIDARHDEYGPYRLLSFPFRFSGAAAQFRHQAPKHGEHTEEILGGLGYAPSDIARLAEQGVVHVPKGKD